MSKSNDQTVTETEPNEQPGQDATAEQPAKEAAVEQPNLLQEHYREQAAVRTRPAPPVERVENSKEDAELETAMRHARNKEIDQARAENRKPNLTQKHLKSLIEKPKE